MMKRPRRLRKNSLIRELTAETRVSKEMLVYPYFVIPGNDKRNPIAAMPGIHHFSVDQLIKDVEKGLKLGLNKVLIFGTGEEKTADGSSSYHSDTVASRAIKLLKETFGEQLYVISDVCVCAYTDHGHCGILEDGRVKNDESVALLSKMALAHARAGADMVAPSDMMDGRIGAIRQNLDENGFQDTAIMSYAIKFASAYYGPFREAADSAPEHGDRKSYQMDFRNSRESMKEAILDENEGADILMVKPALAYLDIISRLRNETNLPLACYNVSGEYSMVKAAAASGLVEEEKLVMENMYAFSRAGADIIISYHAREMLEKGWI